MSNISYSRDKSHNQHKKPIADLFQLESNSSDSSFFCNQIVSTDFYVTVGVSEGCGLWVSVGEKWRETI
jgi:hypothetical protein